jgi:hypothetical protein
VAENITIEKKAAGALFTVYGSTSSDKPELILENITLQGYDKNTSALVVVGNTATSKVGKLTMKAGSRITGNKSSGTATNSGGGVRVAAGGTFIMEDGMIDRNKALGGDGGGVYVTANTVFTMTGGSIEYNEAGSETDDSLYSAQGGGVYTSGTTTISGGVIQHNKCLIYTQDYAGSYGGGVACGGVFTLSEDAVIKDNTAMYGGGVAMIGQTKGNSFIMKENAKIQGNTADTGGGVYVGLLFTMEGGSIEGNFATKCGAAVGIMNDTENNLTATFTKTGGTIYGINAESGKANKAAVDVADTVHAIEQLKVDENYDKFESNGTYRDEDTTGALSTSDQTGWSSVA